MNTEQSNCARLTKISLLRPGQEVLFKLPVSNEIVKGKVLYVTNFGGVVSELCYEVVKDSLGRTETRHCVTKSTTLVQIV